MTNKLPVAVVTGGAVGLGAAISERLARDGFDVVVADIDAAAADEHVEAMRSEGLTATSLTLDVARPDSVREAFASLQREHGRCDVLVNNAGIGVLFPFDDQPVERWAQTLSVNVTGPLLMGQAAVPMMRARQHGRIVNIASISGVRASAGRTAYGTSKAALIGLTRQMAVELARDGITVNAVAPGPVDTPMSRRSHSDKTRDSYARTIPMGRYATTHEVAATVGFLCSDDASFITGHTIPVDGGFLAAGVLET